MKSPLAVLALVGPALLACSSGTEAGRVFGEDARRVVGVIRFPADSAQVEVPSEARVGEELTVAVVTYGGGCVRQGETVVQVTGLQATVVPYDLDSRLSPEVVCTMELRLFRHTATLRFERPGEARVLVKGRELPSGRTVTVGRTVQVR